MINKLSTLGNQLSKAIAPSNTDSKDKNALSVAQIALGIIILSGAVYAGYSIYRSLTAKVEPLPNPLKHAGEKTEKLREDNSKWSPPQHVKKTLDNLFEDSPYSIGSLPVYEFPNGDQTGEWNLGIERNRMTAPVMKGTTPDGRRFIAIQANATLTDEYIDQHMASHAIEIKKMDREIHSTLTLFQRYKDGPFSGIRYKGENMWLCNNGPFLPMFFTSHFTHPETGKGPTESQQENFKITQSFLQSGKGPDIRGLIWTIPKD